MITEQDITATQLSYTKKDFYQIYSELLDTASKLSERWDPTSTNETDPGIVLLKVLTAIADKINYNIDKNVLEAFMPSATQDESMRKLCEMLGYNVKYYQSAETDVVATYKGSAYSPTDGSDASTNNINIPIFTTIKDQDDETTYTLLEGITLTSSLLSNVETPARAIEGEIEDCTTGDSNTITLSNLDDNNRFYLPETQIAENGIFMVNVPDNDTSNSNLTWIGDEENEDTWIKVDNLNIQPTKKKCWKFGYDSKQGLPYIQFPDDIDSIIGSGLYIKYIRTSGINGNISARTLAKFDSLTLYAADGTTTIDDIDPEDIYVTNYSAAKNGANIETINKAYSNYKKTIGTFDTLVTCRDYMNKIYQLTDEHNLPLVSNVIVSDIRDDINNAYKVSTYTQYGQTQVDKSVITSGSEGAISNFDLMIYPFTRTAGLNTQNEFSNSFKYTTVNMSSITSELSDCKTIAHILKNPSSTTDLVCIKNYLNLNAKITTTKKVNTLEEAEIKNNIYTAIYKTFNMRELDFGEEIPFDSILECIENADTRIKNVVLDDPGLETRFLRADNVELSENDSTYGSAWKSTSNRLLIKNILAGRVPLFNYDTDFTYNFTERTITLTDSESKTIASNYPTDGNYIYKIYPTFKIPKDEQNNYVLKENEVVRFSAPNFKTTVTYPAYVNYYLDLAIDSTANLTPAVMLTLTSYMQQFCEGAVLTTYVSNKFLDKLAVKMGTNYLKEKTLSTDDEFKNYYATNAYIYYDNSGSLTHTDKFITGKKDDGTEYSITTYYVLDLTLNNFSYWYKALTDTYPDGYPTAERCLFKQNGTSMAYTPGYLIDEQYTKYKEFQSWSGAVSTSFDSYYMPNWSNKDKNNYGLGIDVVGAKIEANCEYKLSSSQHLYINYTPSTSSTSDTDSDDSSSSTTATPITLDYTDIIIKPNFDLYDSDYKHTIVGNSFSKTSDFDKGVAPVDGMFTLGTSEQIEIREQVLIDLYETPTNVYWVLGDEETRTVTDGKITPFDGTSYVLKENDYFFYTDKYKSDFTVFGSGTEIILNNLTSASLAKKVEDSVDYDTIAENGLNAIPWITLKNLSENNSTYIRIKEYQYITLTEGDTAYVDGNCKKYKIDGTSKTLPEIHVSSSSTDDWQVQTLLSLNCGPDKKQTLNDNDSIIIEMRQLSDDAKLNPPTITINKDNAKEADRPVSFKTNYDLSTTVSADTGVYYRGYAKYNDDGSFKEWSKDGKIRFFQYQENSDENTSYLNDYTVSALAPRPAAGSSDTWTPKTVYVSLGNDSEYGLIMVYTIDTYVKVTTLDKSGGIRLFNTTEDYATEIASLKPGINILQIEKDTTGLEFWNTYQLQTGEEADDHYNTITYSNEVNGIKSIPVFDLGYYSPSGLTTEDKIAEELLADLKSTIASITEASAKNSDIFYYNCPIANSSAININLDNGETTTDPKIYYDYNNINNKFVISEINYSTLKTGISLTRQSKQ